MRTPFLLCLSLLVSLDLAGQTLYIGCKRTLDGARLQADSIRVVCNQLGIDATVAGSEFVLPAITHVPDNPPSSVGTDTEFDAYDLLGRYLGRRTGHAHLNRFRWEPPYGLVILRPLVELQQEQRLGKAEVNVFNAQVFTITAWRAGYHPTTTTQLVTYYDQEIPIALKLLPWWQRIIKISLRADVSKAGEYEYWSGRRGGKSESSTRIDTVPYSFRAFAALNESPANQSSRIWLFNDTSASCHYDPRTQSRPYGPRIDGQITFDTNSGTVHEIWLREDSLSHYYQKYREMRVRNFTEWNTADPGKREVTIVGESAKAALVEVVNKQEGMSVGGTSIDSYAWSHWPILDADSKWLVNCSIELLE